LGPLQDALSDQLPTPGHYQLVIHTNAISKRGNYETIRQCIIEWCLRVAPTLEVGEPGFSSAPHHFSRETIQGVPFEVTLYRWPRNDVKFRIGRFMPEDLEKQRIEVIHKALETRGKKITSYRNLGFRSILVLESNDLALANHVDIGEAFLTTIKEFDSANLPDEIYLVETDLEPFQITCLKFEDTFFPDATILKHLYK
jgi:hypothetical protein